MKDLVVSELENCKKGGFQHILNTPSRNILLEAGVAKDQTIIEVGCGDGDVTLWLSKKVESKGRVYAIDINFDTCEALKRKINNNKIRNVDVINSNALQCLSSLPKVDIVTCRFVLLHNKDKLLELMRAMIDRLKDGGKLVIEEPIMSKSYDSHNIGFWNKAICCYSVLSSITMTDPDIGLKVFQAMKDLGIDVISSRQVQPFLSPFDAKEYTVKALNSHKDDYIKYNVLSNTSFEKTISFYKNFPLEKLSFCAFHAVAQLIGVKRNGVY